MNKKGIQIPWAETLSLLVFLLVLGTVILVFGPKACSLIKKPQINQEQINKFDIFVAQVNALRIEDKEEIFPLKIEENFQIDVYGKCKENHQPGIDCSNKPKICLKDTKNQNINPYCKEVKNTDLEAKNPLTAVNGLKMKKRKEDDKEITRIYT